MRITLVIPARNEARTIARTLDDVLRQSRRPDEVVLVDAGSEDTTGAIVTGHAINRSVPTRLVRAGRAWPGRARNAGVQAASGDWIAFTDAGVRLSPTWLEGLVRAAEAAPEADAIAGDWDVEPANRFAESLALVVAPSPTLARGNETPMRPFSIITLLLRRDGWHRAGPFREDLRSAEDVLFLERLHEACHVVRAPGRHVRWMTPDTPGSTWRRSRIYARHNITAGLFHTWQGPLLRRYAVVAVGAAAIGRWTSMNGWLAALWLWGLMLVARSAAAAYRNRGVYPGGVLRQTRRLMLAVPITALVDAATAAGTIDWLVSDAWASTRTTPVVPDTPAGRGRPR